MHAGWSKSDLNDYKKAQRERLRVYSRADDGLYDMCRKWPDHKNIGIVQAKVRVIGRVYAAGLERKGKRDKLKGIYETVAEIFHENRACIDSEINELNKFKTLSKSSYERILSAHGSMVRFLRKGTRSKSNFRSFSSKYLHFHNSIVPLFDSVASNTINRADWYPWSRYKDHSMVPMSRQYDPVYYKFFTQFVFYFTDLQRQKLRPSVRDADWYLIWSGYEYYD